MHSKEPRFHGLKKEAAGVIGRLHFASARFVRELENSYARPGRSIPKGVPAWTDSTFDDKFRWAAEKLWDTVWKINRVAEMVEGSRQNIRELKDAMPSEEFSQHMLALTDIPIHLETLIYFLRVFADCIANVTPYFYGSKGKEMTRQSFREQRKWFISKCPDFDSQYARILSSETAWFDVLAGNAQHPGLRNALVHYRGGIQLIYRPAGPVEQAKVMAHLYSDYRSFCSDLFPVLTRVVRELFIFLDSYLEYFNAVASKQTNAVVLNLANPDATYLFQYEATFPSAWLYPEIV